MAKSIKFKDENYLDSSSISHDFSKKGFGNKRTLETILDNGRYTTISEPGWYTVAIIKTVGGTDFNIGSSSIISVFQSYYYFAPEIHTLLIEATYQGINIKQLNDTVCRDSSVITHYRVVADNASACEYRLEAYYSRSLPQTVYVKLLTEYDPCVIIQVPTYANQSPATIYKEIAVGTYEKACIACYPTKSTSLSKTGTYGGVEVPLHNCWFNYGDLFEHKNNRIYVTRDCLIHVDISILCTLGDGYILTGSANGSYAIVVGSSITTSLAGHSYTAGFNLSLTAGSYITVSLGRSSAYSGVVLYDSMVSATAIKVY